MSSIPQFVAIPSGPMIAQFGPVIAGSSLEFSMYFEDQTSPGVYAPMNFSGLTLVSEVRLSPFDETAAATLAVTPSATPGYLDFFLSAVVTTVHAGNTLHWGFKMVPADPAHAKVYAMGEINILHAGVR